MNLKAASLKAEAHLSRRVSQGEPVAVHKGDTRSTREIREISRIYTRDRASYDQDVKLTTVCSDIFSCSHGLSCAGADALRDPTGSRRSFFFFFLRAALDIHAVEPSSFFVVTSSTGTARSAIREVAGWSSAVARPAPSDGRRQATRLCHPSIDSPPCL